MRVDSVEIYSDETNAAVMRHPGRHFPGLLLQGDTLHSLCKSADAMCDAMARSSPGFPEANEIRNRLWSYLNHYKDALDTHGLPLPFSH
jgi:hypothetical protein